MIGSLLFNIFFWVWIVIVGVVGFIPSLLYPPLAYYVGLAWAYGSLWALRVFCGITHEVRGREYIPTGAALVASKHQSAWDTIIFWPLLKKPAYVLKRELLFLPVFGQYLYWLKNIYIDRKAGSNAMKKMIKMAQARVKEGRPIVIFPEGTRAAPGVQTTYHPGVAALYQQLDIPVVPVALNSGVLWRRKAFAKKPGVITIEFLPPIPSGLKSRDLLKTLQETIDTASAKLL